MAQFVDIKIEDENGKVYGSNCIIKVDIQQSIPDSASIGNTPSARLCCSIITDSKFLKKERLTFFKKTDNGEWKRFGRFYTDTCVRNGSEITVTAFDTMNYQGGYRVKFTGSKSKGLAKLTFPCYMQDILDYICALRNISCSFKCENYPVEKRPAYNEDENDFYSVREIIGFIASAHGSNAMFDLETGELVFKPYEINEKVEITASNTLDQSLDDSNPFTVTGILFKTRTTDIYIDDNSSEAPDKETDSDEQEGLIECENPIASVAAAEYAWNKLGGMTYYGGKIERRIAADVQPGDIISMPNLKYPTDTENYPVCITSISFSVSKDGFNEVLSGTVSNKSESTVSHGKSTGGSGGVGIFVNPDKNAERFNDYINTDNPCGSFSHAEGNSTTASGHASHAEGYGSTASGEGSHSENHGKAEGNYSHAEGQATAIGIYSHAEGYDTEATGADSHAEGVRSKAVADYSHAEGESTAEGLYSHSEGMTTKATGHSAHSEGDSTTASGHASHAEGLDTKATASMAHAEGMRSEATGYCSHAEGNTTKATGTQSHAEGNSTTASGYCSHAEGGYTVASGEYSHAGGESTIASGDCQTAIGRYNVEDETALFLVGNGTYEERKNALILDSEGNLHVSGNVTADGHVGKEYLAGDGVSITPADEPDVYTVSLTSATADKIGGVKVGNGLEIDENAVLSAKEYAAGGGITIADNAISVNIGDGLEFGEDGKLNAKGGGSSYTAGSGIEITSDEDNDVIGVKLGEGLEFDGNGAIKSVPNIQNAVIIQEANAQYLLHEYTEVEYVAGNKICYGGAQNPITLQGYTVHYVSSSAQVAEGTRYMAANLKSFSGATETEYDLSVEIDTATPVLTKFRIMCNGTAAGTYTTYNPQVMGFAICYTGIHGTVSEAAPYGYGYLEIYAVYETNTGIKTITFVSAPSRKNYAFASQAEYNAAVALTYEPNVLTQVNETVTEV